MEEKKIIESIYQEIEKYGFMNTIKKFFGVGARIQLVFSENACNVEIEKLNLSCRSYNCLKRAGINTVEKVIDAIQENKLYGVRNLGVKSIAEINVRIYEFGYQSLSESARKNFVKDLLDTNREILRVQKA